LEQQPDNLTELARVSRAMREIPTPMFYRADIADRFMLWIADWLIQLTFLGVAAFLWSLLEQALPVLRRADLVEWLIPLLILSVTCIEWSGTSPAKALGDFWIASADERELRWRQLLVRWLVKNFPLFCFFAALAINELPGSLIRSRGDLQLAGTVLAWSAIVVGLVLLAGGILVAFPRRRALHDYIAGTCVLRQTKVKARPDERKGFEAVFRQKDGA
jgi:uncharacterized RDD family membrane protein YckC